jgi:metal-responsive CopG/Arc/MetJ family transcriptional regulator
MTQATRFEMRLSGELRDALNEVRRVERDYPNQSEMIRRLILRELMRIRTADRRAPAREHAE